MLTSLIFFSLGRFMIDRIMVTHIQIQSPFCWFALRIVYICAMAGREISIWSSNYKYAKKTLPFHGHFQPLESIFGKIFFINDWMMITYLIGHKVISTLIWKDLKIRVTAMIDWLSISSRAQEAGRIECQKKDNTQKGNNISFTEHFCAQVYRKISKRIKCFFTSKFQQ